MKRETSKASFLFSLVFCLALLLLTSGCQSTTLFGSKHRAAVKKLVDHMPPERLEKIVKAGEHDALGQALAKSEDRRTLIPQSLSSHFLIDIAKRESWEGCHEALDLLTLNSSKDQWLSSQKQFRRGVLRNLSKITGKSYGVNGKKFAPFKNVELFKKKKKESEESEAQAKVVSKASATNEKENSGGFIGDSEDLGGFIGDNESSESETEVIPVD